MALTTHVTDRFGSTIFLVNLTNQDSKSATTINTTRLAEAATAAEADFPVEAQVDYDDANPAHVNAGVDGVIAYLRMWSSVQGKAGPEMKAFRDLLGNIGKISSRARITPVSRTRPALEGDEDNFHGLSGDFRELSEDF